MSPLPSIIFRNPIILSSWVQRLRSPSAHLVRRRCGTPCWLRLSSAVPGFALQIVSAWFVTFVIQWWRVHCACGCQYIPCQRQRSPSAHLVRRKGGTPCWLHFSWLLLAPAHNRFRVVRDLCFTVVEGPLCARLPIYFLIQRRRSGDSPLVASTQKRIVGNSSFINICGRGNRRGRKIPMFSSKQVNAGVPKQQ